MISLSSSQVEFRRRVDARRTALFAGDDEHAIDFAAEFSALRVALDFEAKRLDVFDDRAPLETYLEFGAALAQAIHIECQASYFETASGREEISDKHASLRAAVDRLVEGYHLAATGGSKDYLFYQMQQLIGPCLTEARAALAAVNAGSQAAADAQYQAAICHEARRLAMLAAAGMFLYYRLTDSRLQASTVRLAKRRERITAHLFGDEDVKTSLDGLEDLERIVLSARIAGGKYIDRPETPYTRMEISPSEELRVHFKNTRWIGVAEEQAVLVKCKVEPADNGIRFAVAEFEGPTSTKGTVWESWLQSEVRDQYDLAPESIHWNASFPTLTSSQARLHLSAHTARRAQNA